MRAISTRRSPSPRGFPWPVAARSRSGRSFTYRTCRQISARMKKPSSVAAYLRAVPPAPRAALQKLRKTIKAAAPFFMSTALTRASREALASYDTSKGTIRFTVDKPLPATLVRKLVKARDRAKRAQAVTASDTHRAIDAVWRIESPKLIAGLARITGDVGLAEDLAHDALVAALERWPESGVPDNPGAWLMATAKHRAIDQLRRGKMLDRKHEQLGHELEARRDTAGPELA